MNEHAYNIGDIIKNTEEFGDVMVKDIFISPTSLERVYAIETIDGSVMLYSTHHLD